MTINRRAFLNACSAVGDCFATTAGPQGLKSSTRNWIENGSGPAPATWVAR